LDLWVKCAWNPVTRIAPQYYETPEMEPNKFSHWRDPFLFEYQGVVYHYVCARRDTGENRSRGTLGLAKTDDMRHWEVLPPPEVAPVCSQLEVPQLYHWQDCYYLVFSANAGWFADDVYARYPREHFRDAGYSMVGPTPFGPFKMYGTGQILPPEYTPQPYAVQIVFRHGQPYVMGTIWNDEQDFICDPIPVQFTPTGVRKK
jgi:beta-fructofuranosidase